MKKNKRKGAPKHCVNQNAFVCIQVYGLYLFWQLPFYTKILRQYPDLIIIFAKSKLLTMFHKLPEYQLAVIIHSI